MPLVNGVYRPDFQADTSLPQWQQMGDNQQQADQAGAVTGSFVDMLKKRMGGGKPLGGYSAPTPTSNTQAVGHEAMHDLPAVGGVAKGGGMKSL